MGRGRNKGKKRRKKFNWLEAEKGQKVYKVVEQAETNRAVVNKATEFKLHIPELPYNKIMYWINKSTDEVSGFGHLEFDEDKGIFTVVDAMLIEQHVGPGETEMDANAIGKAMFQFRDVPNALKWHWHSHPTFGCFWSGTDMNLIRELGQQDWILASVFNQKREYRTAFFQTVEIMGRKHDMFVDEIPTTVMYHLTDEFKNACDEEFAAKVHKRPIQNTHYTGKIYTQKDFDKEHIKPYVPAYMREYESEGGLWDDFWGTDGHGNETAFLPRAKSGRTPRAIADNEYGPYGFATVDGLEIYNPLQDKDCQGQEALQFIMIDDMNPEEIEFLRKCDHLFDALFKRYLVAKAEDQPIKAESEWQESGI